MYHAVVVYFTYSESLTAYTETQAEQVVCVYEKAYNCLI